jgi:glucosamine--fructose-6-phosphate aminotransferase (isomerizing)
MLPGAVEGALGDPAPVQTLVPVVVQADAIVLVARGHLYGAAHEVALKLKEAARANAQAYSTADFMHGPIAALGPGAPVLALSARGPTQADVVAVQEEVSRRGGRSFEISDRPEAAIALPRLPEPLTAIAAVVRGQQLALEAALARGLDPDRPFGLSKVTETA